MEFPASAVERAMTYQQGIMRALAGTWTWLKAADVLGIHPRSLRRWRARYERDPVLGLLDRRRRRPSHRTAPRAEAPRVLKSQAMVQRYAHLSPDYVRAAVERMAKSQSEGGTGTKTGTEQIGGESTCAVSTRNDVARLEGIEPPTHGLEDGGPGLFRRGLSGSSLRSSLRNAPQRTGLLRPHSPGRAPPSHPRYEVSGSCPGRTGSL